MCKYYVKKGQKCLFQNIIYWLNWENRINKYLTHTPNRKIIIKKKKPRQDFQNKGLKVQTFTIEDPSEVLVNSLNHLFSWIQQGHVKRPHTLFGTIFAFN